VRRVKFPPTADFFDDSYDLYAHDPGRTEEVKRQQGYAAWLASVIAAPTSVFEAGCGNGSLLLALGMHWPQAQMRGIEPAPRAAAAAARAGFDVSVGILDRSLQHATTNAALALSVNVLEHAANPEEFVAALAHQGDRVAVVCPDGSTPNTELLFFDHLHSFTPEHVARLFKRAGISVDLQQRAPSPLGNFQLTLGTVGAATPESPSSPRPWQAIAAYLDRWRNIDTALLAKIGGHTPIACFGVGESAGLLRAYAPNTWKRIVLCTVDEPDTSRFGEIPVCAITELQAFKIILGVRPAAQGAVAERLAHMGHEVFRWDDLIEA
jgi:SAM-dependent methyltransferase